MVHGNPFLEAIKYFWSNLRRPRWWLVIAGLVAWEIVKDRFANWANKSIDENSGPVMKAFVSALNWLANTPIGWTVLLVVIVLLALLIHSYVWSLKHAKPSDKEGNRHQSKPNPFDQLAKECQEADATHIKLVRKPHIFIMRWIFYLEKLRRERNTHDIVNLFNLIGPEIHTAGHGNANVGIQEVLFTIKCLAIRGYITLEKSDHGHNSLYENQNIKFNVKYDEFIGKFTFKETAGEYSVYW